jgi:hypothetical protein
MTNEFATSTAASNADAAAAAALHKATVNYAYLLLKDHFAVDYEYTVNGAHYTDDPATLIRLIGETHGVGDEVVARAGNQTDAITRDSSPNRLKLIPRRHRG